VYLPDKTLKLHHTGGDDPVLPYEYDEKEASLMVGLNWPSDPAYPDINAVKDKRAYLMSKVKHWHPGYTHAIEAIEERDIYTVQGRASKPLAKNWRRETQKSHPENPDTGNPRVWMIGDAIHPMLPSRGMGANQALHDCADALIPLLELAEAKQKDAASDEQVFKAVRSYESKMIPRAFEWVKKSGGTNQNASKHFPTISSMCESLR
jgi:2-polyprenyl-6-methoxyphenol hydroxylase-like FAD-dependent oxidoreductase